MGLAVAHLAEIASSLSGYMQDMEVEIHSGSSAVEAYDLFVLVERLAAAGKATMARRVDETNAWRDSGARNAADFLASRSGVSSTVVGKDLATARRLEELPSAQAAFRAGKVDKNQISKFAQKADAQADAAFAKMLASGPTPEELQKHLAKINKPKTKEEDLKAAQKTATSKRYAKFEVDPEDNTMFLAVIAGPVAELPLIKARLKPFHDSHFTTARKEKRRERHAALEYDAFMDLLQSGGSSKPVKSIDKGIIRVADNGRCEIVGVGEVTTAVALKYASEKHFRVLDEDADTRGDPAKPRNYPVPLVTALMARDPECKVPGCTVTVGLELEHRLPVQEGGQSELLNMWRCCAEHHRMKTYKGWCLTGDLGTGNVKWEKLREKGDGGSGYKFDQQPEENNQELQAG